MTHKEIALNLVQQLMSQELTLPEFANQAAQCDQAFGVTSAMLDALAAQSNDPRITSLAELVRLAWSQS